jgi:hypothetical protein
MTGRIFLIAAILIIAVGVALFYQAAAISSRSEGELPVYSAERYDPYGTAALRELLANRGIAVHTLEQPNLDSSSSGVLIQVLTLGAASGGRSSNHVPTEQLVDWMMQGNTIIQFSRSPTDLMDRMKIAASTQPTGASATSAEEFETDGDSPDQASAQVVVARADLPQPAGSPPANAAPSIVLWSPMVFAEPDGPSTRPIARRASRGDNAVAVTMNVGRGRLIVIGAPTPALNGFLNQRGNLDFLLALIGNGPVIFDEWSHGIGHEATVVGFIHDVGLLPLLVQLGFMALLYVWSTSGHRRNDAAPAARQRSSIEQIQTLGYLYSRSFDTDATFKQVNAEVQRRLCEALRCPANELPARAAALRPELRRRYDELTEEISRNSPEKRVPCPHCQYELYALTSDRCPECGTPISSELRQAIEQAAAEGPPGANRRRFRLDAALAGLLTLSHQLTLEVQRDRRAH